MKKKASPTPDTQAQLFVCSTSHMDWDWINTFEGYYSAGLQNHNPVRFTLDQAYVLFTLLPTFPRGQAIPSPVFQYNLAEVAWLRRWLLDNPDKQAGLAKFGKNYCFMGGGITSPDNLVCNGEVFIRNYLVGRQFLRDRGLSDQISDVCWIPDDFGSDPELPTTLKAMGLKAAAFWRVPGGPPINNQPLDGSPSIYKQLTENGVCFTWEATDGSQVTALLLAAGYGTPASVSGTTPSDTASDLDTFVTKSFKWPTENQFIPSGSDFSTPSTNLAQGIAIYNQNDAPTTKIQARFGTFEAYLNTLPELSSRKLNPSNYWTGHFASRPQLKIEHNRAARYLLAAETAYSMLQVFSKYSSGSLAGIGGLIHAGWEALVPSSHHDFINGTAPDGTYWSEQLPLLETAVDTAQTALDLCLGKMAQVITTNVQSSEQPILIYNDLGFKRSLGTLIELNGITGTYQSVRIGTSHFPIQKSSDGTVLLQCQELDAMSYQTVYLSPEIALQPVVPPISLTDNLVSLSNGLITISISRADNWGITSMVYNNNPSQNFVNGIANQIQIYEDAGNLYQFGNELLPADPNGFVPESNPDLSPVLGSAQVLESGPLRWRFQGQLKSEKHKVTYTLEYTLVANEPVVHMRLQGAAPADISNSVVTHFPIVDAQGNPPTGMSYGTANHWHQMDVKPYWNGPTFRAIHDFALLDGQARPLGAIYHQGTPAWAFENNVLLGVLLRNAYASSASRGAGGIDTAEHTQEYAFRLSGLGTPDTCQPLQEAYAVQQAPFAKLIGSAPTQTIVNMAESNQLAALKESNAVVRMVRTQPGSGSAPTNATSIEQGDPLSLIFRIYQPSNNTSQTITLNLSFASAGDQPIEDAETLTALEEEKGLLNITTISDNSVSIPETPTITTVRIQTRRPYLMPSRD